MSIKEIQDQAAAWLAREDRNLSAAEQAELTAWLEQSTMHEVCYLRLQAAWERTDRLAALNPPMMRPAISIEKKRRLLAPVLAGLAAAVIVAAIGGYYTLARLHSPQSYATGIGGTQSLRLADGTRVQLNSDTRLRTDISSAMRAVTLDTGEAYFEVVHDAKRPFVVYAASKRIIDLGTKFSVYRNGDNVRVIVKEGRVRVTTVEGDGAGQTIVADGGHVVLTRGIESLVSERPQKDIANDLSWRSGMLVFDQQTLGEAAEEFNRYNSKKLVIEGNARSMKIGGRFKANNVDSFIFLLHRGFGLSVNDRGNSVIVSR